MTTLQDIIEKQVDDFKGKYWVINARDFGIDEMCEFIEQAITESIIEAFNETKMEEYPHCGQWIRKMIREQREKQDRFLTDNK